MRSLFLTILDNPGWIAYPSIGTYPEKVAGHLNLGGDDRHNFEIVFFVVSKLLC